MVNEANDLHAKQVDSVPEIWSWRSCRISMSRCHDVYRLYLCISVHVILYVGLSCTISLFMSSVHESVPYIMSCIMLIFPKNLQPFRFSHLAPPSRRMSRTRDATTLPGQCLPLLPAVKASTGNSHLHGQVNKMWHLKRRPLQKLQKTTKARAYKFSCNPKRCSCSSTTSRIASRFHLILGIKIHWRSLKHLEAITF